MLLIGGFSAVKERALMAKYLYRFFKEDTQQIKIPKCLEVRYLAHWLFFCCRNKDFKDYNEILRKAERNIAFDMDIV